MTDTDRDAQTIREALESAFGDWEAGLAALERLVAALSAATAERDEAREALRDLSDWVSSDWYYAPVGLEERVRRLLSPHPVGVVPRAAAARFDWVGPVLAAPAATEASDAA